jgi:hypothetical protein
MFLFSLSLGMQVLDWAHVLLSRCATQYGFLPDSFQKKKKEYGLGSGAATVPTTSCAIYTPSPKWGTYYSSSISSDKHTGGTHFCGIDKKYQAIAKTTSPLYNSIRIILLLTDKVISSYKHNNHLSHYIYMLSLYH